MLGHINTLEQVIELVFTGPPKPPRSYTLDENLLRFPILFTLSLGGLQLLYGQDYNISNITKQELDKLNEYLASIGITLKYIFRGGTKFDFWFELWLDNKNCHGGLCLR